jgi:tetratricopeptide (TPR) repeat protein
MQKQLEQGLLADFDLLIKNNWKMTESKEKRAWFIADFSSFQIEATRLNRQGTELRETGQYPQAELALLKALELRKKLLGENSPLTLTSKNNLAMLYFDQGRYELAEPLLKEALNIRREILGDKHIDTLTSMDNLGQLYRVQGRYKQAEPLFMETLGSTDELVGNPLTNHFELTVMNNLAHVYKEQGKYKIAEMLLGAALSLQKPQIKVSPLMKQNL